MKKNIFFILYLAVCSMACSQPAAVTPVNSLGLRRVKIDVPAKFIGNIDTAKCYVNLPPGYNARMFYVGGLLKPRFMAFDDYGVLHVCDYGISSNGRIIALPDKDNDGVADTSIIVAQGFLDNHDVKFYKGAMYVTEIGKVDKLEDLDKDGIYETKTTFISGLPTAAGHSTRTIVFDSINHKVYLSIGSSCNVCRESNRAIIEQYNDDGSGKRTFATGIRNAVGMTLHPMTNRLWADNNGSDLQGDTIPPEWVDIVRDGGFYGHPFAHSNGIYFNFNSSTDYQALKPITAADSALVSTMIPPAALVHAHMAPMAIQFLNPSFPGIYHNGFLMALRGSWNTTNYFVGYKLVYADLSNATDTTVNTVSDFCTGFLTDSINRVYWGRPVGLAINNQGQIFMSSDEANKFIMMIYPDKGLGMNMQNKRLEAGNNYPDPFNTSTIIPFELYKAGEVNLQVYDVSGKVWKEIDLGKMEAGPHEYKLDTKQLPAGVYLYRLKSGDESVVKRMVCTK